MKRLSALIALCLSLSACAGGGGGSSSATSNLSGLPPVSPNGTAASTAGVTTVTTTGSIAGFFSGGGGFTLNQGPPHGYIHIYTSSSTTMPTGLKVGTQVQVVGTGSVSTSITATSVSLLTSGSSVQPTPTPVPIPINTPTVTEGKIAAVKAGTFQIGQAYPHGYIWITYTASTTIVGGTPAVGQFATVAGVGSQRTGIAASEITLWAAQPGTTTASGGVVAGTPWGFTLNADATHPAVPIILTPTTVIAGGVLESDSHASVTGEGDVSGSITATQVIVVNPTPVAPPTPTPGPIAQKHLVTADYLMAPNGSGTVTPAQAAPYVDWAQSYVANAPTLRAAGIKAQVYANPNRSMVGNPMYTTDETTYAHDCSGTRVTDLYKTKTQYVMDPGSSNMQTLFRNTVLSQAKGNTVDGYFVDDSGPLSDFAINSPFSPGLPCGYTDAQWTAGGIALDDAAPAPVIFNGLNVLNGHDVSLSIGLLDGANTIGGNFENCYSNMTLAKVNGWAWTATENTELQVIAKNKIFECESLNTALAEQSYDARTYLLASFLLTYHPDHSIFWEFFKTTSGLHALPEAQLVPMDPVVPSPLSIDGLLKPGGAYGREYQHCYLAGNFVGPCAIAVNPSTSLTASFPYPQYTHSLALSGSDVLDGGSVATNGPAVPSTMAPSSAAIVFP